MQDQRFMIEEAVRETLAAVAECPDLIERREWFTPSEAGEYLRLSDKTLENLRLRGEGPVFSRLGHRIVRYRRADLDAWLEAGRRT
ncbi:MAG: helix-turn-helix domain-containing protein [Pseudomonadota bacterium]